MYHLVSSVSKNLSPAMVWSCPCPGFIAHSWPLWWLSAFFSSITPSSLLTQDLCICCCLCLGALSSQFCTFGSCLSFSSSVVFSEGPFLATPLKITPRSSLVPLTFLHSAYHHLKGFCWCTCLLIDCCCSPTAMSALRADSGYFVSHSVLEPCWHMIGTQYLLK